MTHGAVAHESETRGATYPGGHVRQVVAPDMDENVPGGQNEQLPGPAEAVPGPHVKHVPAITEPSCAQDGPVQPVPGAQLKHVVCWALGCHVPNGQMVDAPAASVGTYEPGGAFLHVKEPAAANVPALHLVSWVELEHANPAGHVVHILVT